MKSMKSTISFKCPRCSTGVMEVKDSRPAEIEGHFVIRRRRACRQCKFRVSTHEVIEGVDLRHHRRIRSSYDRIYEALARIQAQFRELDRLERQAQAGLNGSDVHRPS